MINRTIEWCVKNRFLVIAGILLLIGFGYQAMLKTPVDAIPDIGELQVIVFADWPGRSPQDIEDQVIYPLTTKLLGIPQVKVVRSTSAFSFGIVNIIFEDNTDYYWARTRVLERMNLALQDLPSGVLPVLGPDATALGQIFWYTVENGYYCPDHPEIAYKEPGKCPFDGKELVHSEYDLGELRSIHDWYILYQLNSVQGVSEVASVGGFVKQYQIDIDPNVLLAYGITLKDVFTAVKQSNIDVGAKVLEEGQMEFIIRGVGFIKSIADIEDIVITAREGAPICIKNIATVTVGPDFRRGVLDKEGVEVTGGVVLMRYGENPLAVIERVKLKIKEIEAGLSPGVRIVPFYDRTEIINRAKNTLKTALIEEIIVCIAVILPFMGGFASTIIVSLVLPISIMIAFLFMYLLGMPSNIMSLGGMAIAIGVIVDAGIVMSENIIRHLAEQKEGTKSRQEICLEAAKEVGPPIFFAILIIIVAFIPVFVLRGQSGKLFFPLALTKTFVMSASAILAISLLPVLCSFFLGGTQKRAEDNRLSQLFLRVYRPFIAWSMNHRKVVLFVCTAIFIATLLLIPRIQSEFMPPLNEGDLLFMPVLLPGASLNEVKEVMRKQDIIIKQLPEVELVVGKLGRAETPTDPAPIAMIETIIKLKPKKLWRESMTREKLIQEIKEKTRMPGVSPIMTQPIRNRIDMLATGIQTPIGIKVFGNDLKENENVAVKIEKLISTIPGALNPYAERVGNRPYLEITINRKEIARYGIRVQDVQDTIMVAIGGVNLTTTVEGRERYAIRVRYKRELVDNMESLKRILVSTPQGAHIPLVQLAEIKKVPGPAMIASENTLPYTRVFISVDPEVTGIVDFVKKATTLLEKKIKPYLSPGSYYAISGQYEYELQARRQLLIVIPVCLFIIILLLYLKFRSFSSTFLLISALPFAFSGALVLQVILGYKFSTVVWVGYIALFGIAVEDGIVIVEYMQELCKRGGEVKAQVIQASLLRVRPIIMTTTTTILALLPIMLSTGAGSEVMKPIATPTVGGMITCTISNLIVVPLIFSFFEERKRHRTLKRG
ncbi:MAG: CusA/CzcA family heavy metal efflux RND transporter [Thermodesulfobacteriota bacterium]|nr:CusA/CzcA family heavy metal efflux RND transporter [Thermodesulfobacteriota bacterium]